MKYYQTKISPIDFSGILGSQGDLSKPRFCVDFKDDFKHCDIYHRGRIAGKHNKITLDEYMKFGEYIALGYLTIDIKKAKY